MEYEGCFWCNKNLCNCEKYTTEYEWGGDVVYCTSCYKKHNLPIEDLYEYFKNKYDEKLSFEEVREILNKNYI